jgi:hypothetical protein
MCKELPKTGTMVETSISPIQQELEHRENFFVPVYLGSTPINCGDHQSNDTNELLIRVFGGTLNFAYLLSVLGTIYHPSQNQPPFIEQVHSTTNLLNQIRALHCGVHGDSQSENQSSSDPNIAPTDPVVCNYAQNRTAISRYIFQNGNSILDEAQRMDSNLARNSSDYKFAQGVIVANYILSETKKENFFGKYSGKMAIQVALREGAPILSSDRPKYYQLGIINEVPNTTFDTNAANQANQGAYTHDSWAVHDIMEELQAYAPTNSRHVQIANLIDTIGTMQFIGVENVALRSQDAIF